MPTEGVTMGVYDSASQKVTWYKTFTRRTGPSTNSCYLYNKPQQCPTIGNTVCPANVSGMTFASIAWTSNLPSLCGKDKNDLSPCDAIRIGPSDMDKLAKMAAGGSGCSGATESSHLIGQINDRYIAGVLVTGDSAGNLCTAYDGQAPGPGGPTWMTIKDKDGNDITGPLAVGMKKAQIRDGTGSGTNVFEPVTSTSGCGWWGRGVIQTSGPCNFGKLNHALKNVSLYTDASTNAPLFSLCRTPEVLCNTAKFGELKWVSGMFYWRLPSSPRTI